jgi:hypothetical protein
MVLIPPDAGIRMRMQTDASLLQPVQPTHEIPSDLPELQPGQVFTARVMETLPDNTYKALVAGKLLTLQLPEGAKPGDTLELVLVDRSAKTLIAQRVDAQASTSVTAQAYENTNISRAGQMIGQLLLPEGETPQPAQLNRGEPLLAQAPANAADLAPTLAKAVSQSGLFYEAHQAEWVAGRRPMESLQAEPQGQVQVSATSASGQTATTSATATSTVVAMAEHSKESAAQQAANPAQTIPDQLRPLVQQQLDAVATQRLAWHGEVWPGQVMDLQIERERTEERNARTTGNEDEQRWNSTLRLSMPQLGAIDATLQLSGNKLRLRLTATTDTAATNLRANSAELMQALGAAGVSIQSFEVNNEPG